MTKKDERERDRVDETKRVKLLLREILRLLPIVKSGFQRGFVILSS